MLTLSKKLHILHMILVFLPADYLGRCEVEKEQGLAGLFA